MDHFEGRVPAWDVVNEAFASSGARRDCLWQRVIGDDWIAQALRAARAADPSARLFYNETAADFPNAKFGAVEAMAQDFRARGVPLDGVGLQYHVHTGSAPLQFLSEDAMRRLGALGLAVHVSELDAFVSQFGGTHRREARPPGAGVPDRRGGLPGGRRVLPDHALGRRRPLVLARPLGDGGGARRRLPREARLGGHPRGDPSRGRPARASRPRRRGSPRLPRRRTPACSRSRGRPPGTPRAPGSTTASSTATPTTRAGRPWRAASASTGFSFAGGRLERQGTYRYRVRASDGTRAGAWSPESAVGRGRPHRPVAARDRARPRARRRRLVPRPRDADVLRVLTAALLDGSAGSGVDPASVPAPRTFAATGSHTVSGIVRRPRGQRLPQRRRRPCASTPPRRRRR